MIEFTGKISGQALKFFARRYKKLLLFSSLLASLMLLLLLGRTYFLISMIVIMGITISLIFIVIPAKVWGLLAPIRVYIELEERTITAKSKGNPEVFRMIDDIIEVKDHGDFYTFKFNSKRHQYDFIAQKELITQGTIEEFEEIFEEVLVRVK